jgi:hypothetical protein
MRWIFVYGRLSYTLAGRVYDLVTSLFLCMHALSFVYLALSIDTVCDGLLIYLYIFPSHLYTSCYTVIT